MIRLLPCALLLLCACEPPDYGEPRSTAASWIGRWEGHGEAGARTVSGRVAVDAEGGPVSTAVYHLESHSQVQLSRHLASFEHRVTLFTNIVCFSEPCGERARVRHAVTGDTVFVVGSFGSGQEFFSSDHHDWFRPTATSTGFILRITGEQGVFQVPLGGESGAVRPVDVAVFEDGTFGIVGWYQGQQSLRPDNLGQPLNSEKGNGFFARFSSDGRVMVARDLPEGFQPRAMAVNGSQQVGVISSDEFLALDAFGQTLWRGGVPFHGSLADVTGAPTGGWWVISTDWQPDCAETLQDPVEGWRGTGHSELAFVDDQGVSTRRLAFLGNATALGVSANGVLIGGTTDQRLQLEGLNRQVTGVPKAFALNLNADLRVTSAFVGTIYPDQGACRATGVAALGANGAVLGAILDLADPGGPAQAALLRMVRPDL